MLALLASVLPARAAAAPAVLYLNFSEGNQTLQAGNEDDATRNISKLCATHEPLRWDGASDCDDRESCKDLVTELVRDQLSEFDVDVTSERPHGTYTMALIGPASPGCEFGVLGLSDIDCGNRNAANVVLAYACSTDSALCATVITHEFAHSLGLDHVVEQTDIMRLGVRGGDATAFRDVSSQTVDPRCEPVEQNSYRSMLSALGPRRSSPDGQVSGSGACTLQASATSDDKPVLLLVLVAVWLSRRRALLLNASVRLHQEPNE